MFILIPKLGTILLDRTGGTPWRVVGILIWIWLLAAQAVSAETTAKGDPQQAALEKMVHQAERQIEHTIKKEGFFSARVALNVWKSTALDAGLYDQATYDAFRQRIYQRSIDANRRWFEDYVKEKNYRNAGTCLEFWRLHSLDLGVLDPEEYEALKKWLAEAQKKNPAK